MKATRALAGAAAALALSIGVPLAAQAAVVSVTDPGLSSEIGARIRWGATGFEASVYDNSPLNQRFRRKRQKWKTLEKVSRRSMIL